MYFISCRLIQIAHLFAGVFQRVVGFGLLGLLLSLAPRLMSSLEEVARGEQLRSLIRCRHSDRRLLLLVEVVLGFAEHDALHASGGHPGCVSKEEGIVFGVATRLWW